VAPHLSFLDMSGHGGAVMRAGAGADPLEVEFVGIPP